MHELKGDYPAWVTWCERFANGASDPPADLARMEKGSGAVAIERLTQHVYRSLQARLDLWLRNMDRDYEHALSLGGDAALQRVRIVLVQARSQLEPIRRFAGDDRLPEHVVAEMSRAVDEMIVENQRQREEDARRGGRPNEDLLRLVLEIPLDKRFVVQPPPSTAVGQAKMPAFDPASSRRRRILD